MAKRGLLLLALGALGVAVHSAALSEFDEPKDPISLNEQCGDLSVRDLLSTMREKHDAERAANDVVLTVLKSTDGECGQLDCPQCPEMACLPRPGCHLVGKPKLDRCGCAVGCGEFECKYDACDGKRDGDSCTLCDPLDLQCAETRERKTCTNGICAARPECPRPCPTPACQSPPPNCRYDKPERDRCGCVDGCGDLICKHEPCKGKRDGDSCTLCDPLDLQCAETRELKTCQDGVCTDPGGGCDGRCLVPDCPRPPPGYDYGLPERDECGCLVGCGELIRREYDPCEGKRRGEQCTECHPADRGCVETKDLKTCQPDGSCKPHRCPPRCPALGCPPLRADCNATKPLKLDECGCARDCPKEVCPPYDPCDGKNDGAECTVCDPADLDCFETEILKTCERGVCGAHGGSGSGGSGGGGCLGRCEDMLCAKPTRGCYLGKPALDDCGCPVDCGEEFCPWLPCRGLKDGDVCSVCNPKDADCAETAERKTCQDGRCAAEVGEQCAGACALPICPEPRERCRYGKPESDRCGCPLDCGKLRCSCGPGEELDELTGNCVITSCGHPRACPANQECKAVTCVRAPCAVQCTAGYEACQGKAEGERCLVCDPTDRGCYETATVKTCQSGACAPGKVVLPSFQSMLCRVSASIKPVGSKPQRSDFRGKERHAAFKAAKVQWKKDFRAKRQADKACAKAAGNSLEVKEDLAFAPVIGVALPAK